MMRKSIFLLITWRRAQNFNPTKKLKRIAIHDLTVQFRRHPQGVGGLTGRSRPANKQGRKGFGHAFLKQHWIEVESLKV
jgi:hypothetical protein